MNHPNDHITTSLNYIADKLTTRAPEQLMTPRQRLGIALTAADRIHPHNETASNHLENELLRLLPYVEGNVVTRGEYALWLRATAKQAHAS